MRLRLTLVPLAALAIFSAGCSSDPKPAPQPQKATAPAPVRILHFYASPGVVAAGEPVTLCYGVENAASVKLSPAVADVNPSPGRCVQFTPRRTGTYTLTAGATDGKELTESLAIRVTAATAAKPAAPAKRMIETFASSAGEVAPGQPVTLCYVVRNADSVKVDPPLDQPGLGPKACASVRPSRTTTYTLTASGAGGSETERLTIRVRAGR